MDTIKYNLKWFFLLSVILFSCKDDFGNDIMDEDNSRINEEELVAFPTLHNSKRLRFNNIKSFEKVLYDLSADLAYAKSVEESGFKSLRSVKFDEYKKKYSNINKKELDENRYSTFDVDDLFIDPITQSVIDENYELMIEDNVYRYTKFGTFVYDVGDENEAINTLKTVDEVQIKSIYASHDFYEESFYELNSSLSYFGDPDFSSDNDYSIIPVLPDDPIGGGGGGNPAPNPMNNHRFCNSSTNIRAVTKNYGHWTGGIRNTSYIYFENSRRMKAKIWSTSYGTHSTSGFFTKLQTRTLGVWWASDANRVSVSANGTVKFPNPNPATSALTPYMNYSFTPDNGGYANYFNTNKAQTSFGIYTMEFKIKPNSSIPIIPTPKYAKRVKLTDVATCHFVSRGTYNGEIQFKVSEN